MTSRRKLRGQRRKIGINSSGCRVEPESQAAERGSGDACWELADVFLDRSEAQRDYPRAHALMMLGATLAHPKCLQQLGVMYLTGVGVSADPALGFNYTLRAAKLGDHDAQYGAGICCLRGVGTTRDLQQARDWLACAARAGNARAASALKEIT